MSSVFFNCYKNYTKVIYLDWYAVDGMLFHNFVVFSVCCVKGFAW